MKQPLHIPLLLIAVICCPSYIVAQYAPLQQIGTTEAYLYGQYSNHRSLQHADIDSDGISDIICIGRIDGSPCVMIYKGTSGENYEPPSVIISGYDHIMNIAHIDANHDGNLDIQILARQGNNPVQILSYSNIGGGAFNSTPNSIGVVNPVDLSTEASLTQADLNGDGWEDLIIARYGGSASGNFWWYSNDGTPNFGTRFNLPSQSWLLCMEAADLDGDGDTDLVVARDYVDVIRILINDGSGNFSYAQTIDYQAADLIIADMDNDSDNDIVILRYDFMSVVIFSNNGNGDFTIGFSQSFTFDYMPKLSALDIDNDNLPELFVSSLTSDSNINHTYIFHNQSASSQIELLQLQDTIALHASALKPGLSALGNTHLLLQGIDGLYIVRFAPNITLELISDQCFNIEPIFLDIDQDGFIDIVQTLRGNMIWRRNLGDFSFSRSQFLVSNLPNITEIIGNSDFNNDGYQDLICLAENDNAYNVIVLFMAANGSVFSVQYNDFPGLLYLDFGDLNSDGVPDLAYSTNQSIRVLLNDGTGNFTQTASFVNSSYSMVRIVDIDSDGLNDIVYDKTNCPGSCLGWQKNNAGGVFIAQANLPSLNNTSRAFIPLDLNGDGPIDILFNAQTSPRFCQNEGLGQFSIMTTLPFVNPNQLIEWTWPSKTNHDSLVDYLFFTGGSSETKIWSAQSLADSTYQLFGPIEGPYTWRVPFTTPRRMGADFNNDSLFDLILLRRDEGNFGVTGLGIMANRTGPNFVQGNVYHDMNGNSSRDIDEFGIHAIPIHTNCNTVTYTSGSGLFSLSVANDDSCLTEVIPPLHDTSIWSVSQGSGGYILDFNQSNIIDSIDFGLFALVDSSAFELAFNIAPNACGVTTSGWIAVKNRGSRTENGSIALSLPSGFTFLTSSLPAIVTDNGEIQWSLDSLFPFQTKLIALNVILPDISYINDTLASIIRVDSYADGMMINSVAEEFAYIVACSYDPNDKQVLPIGYGQFNAVDDTMSTLSYTIRFQNTGNAPAYNVLIRDTISSYLDINSIEIIGSSHEVEIGVDDRCLLFNYNQIMLPDSASDFLGSQGFVTFNIRVLTSDSYLISILNKAHIYFDMNDAIITNEKDITIVDCDQWQPTIENISSNILQASSGDNYHWALNGELLSGATQQSFSIVEPGLYSVLVTSEYGCTNWSEDFDFLSLSLNSISDEILHASPNPFSESTIINWSDSLGPYMMFELFDGRGNLIRKWDRTGRVNMIIERRNLAPGLYVLRSTSLDGTYLGYLELIIE